MSLRVVFMGTPDFSVAPLAAIIGAGHRVAAVYSQPPRPAGRGMEPRKSAVQVHAEAAGIEVRTPVSLRDAAEQSFFARLQADVAVVVAYGLILPRPVLDAPRFGCLNLHASKLPRWRGAAPIQRAIMAGDGETAMMVMQMDEGLDTGPVCLAEPVAIGLDTTAGALHDRLSALGAEMIVTALEKLEAGTLVATPQPLEGVSYASKIDKAECRIDFARPARAVHDQIRGLSPYPGAFFDLAADGRPERVKVLASEVLAVGAGPAGVLIDDSLAVACADGAVRILALQRAGKRPMSAVEFLRGFPLPAGARLG